MRRLWDAAELEAETLTRQFHNQIGACDALPVAVAIAPAVALEPIETISDVADRAILIKLTIRMFGLARQDAAVNAETAARYGANPAMSWNVSNTPRATTRIRSSIWPDRHLPA